MRCPLRRASCMLSGATGFGMGPRCFPAPQITSRICELAVEAGIALRLGYLQYRKSHYLPPVILSYPSRRGGMRPGKKLMRTRCFGTLFREV